MGITFPFLFDFKNFASLHLYAFASLREFFQIDTIKKPANTNRRVL